MTPSGSAASEPVNGPVNGWLASHSLSGADTGKASTVMLTVAQCIRNGIDRDATSTISHACHVHVRISHAKKIQANPHDATEKQ